MFFKKFRIPPEVKKALPWTPYSWTPSQNSLLCDWSMYPNVDPSKAEGKCDKFTLNKRLSVWFYRITDSFLYFQGRNHFRVTSLNSDFDFFNNKATKYCKNHQCMNIKYIFNNIGIQQISSREPIPLRHLSRDHALFMSFVIPESW